MNNCPICFRAARHAENSTAAIHAQRRWENQHAELASAYAPNEIPAHAVANLGPRPDVPAAPQGTVEERLLHLEHRIEELADVEPRLADVEQHLALTHGVDAEHPQ